MLLGTDTFWWCGWFTVSKKDTKFSWCESSSATGKETMFQFSWVSPSVSALNREGMGSCSSSTVLFEVGGVSL